jgi:hypothetical protein
MVDPTDNNVGAAPACRFRGDEWAAFDRLPIPLRRAINEGIVLWDARWVRWSLNKRLKAGMPEAEAVASGVDALRSADEDEVRAFRYRWPARFGRHPHTAAGATIQRYGKAADAA